MSSNIPEPVGLIGSGGISHLCIAFDLVSNGAPVCDGIHITNWDHGTFEDICIYRPTGTNQPGVINNTEAYTNGMGTYYTGYSSSGGIVFDYYGDSLPDSGATVPGQYFGGDLIVFGSDNIESPSKCPVGIFFGGITQVFFRNVEILSIGGDGCFLLDSTNILIVNFVSEGATGIADTTGVMSNGYYPTPGNGLSLWDDGRSGGSCAGNIFSNVYFRNNAGFDVFAYGSLGSSVGNVVTSGVSHSTPGANVMVVNPPSLMNVPMVNIEAVHGISDSGLQSAAPLTPTISSGSPVNNPYPSAAAVTITSGGGTNGTAVSVRDSSDIVILSYSQSPGAFPSTPFYVPAGGSIELTYTGTAPTWAWAGMIGQTAVGLLQSGTMYVYYNTFPFKINVYIRGGAITQVYKNGTEIFAGSGVAYCLNPGDSTSLTFSTAPTAWNWDAAS